MTKHFVLIFCLFTLSTASFAQIDTSAIIVQSSSRDSIVATSTITDSDTLENYDPRSIFIVVQAGNTLIHKTYKPSVTSNLNSTEDLLQDYLKDWFKTKLDSKPKKKKGSLLIEEVNIVDIASGLLNVYFNIDTREKKIKLDMAIQVNSSYYIDSVNTPALFVNSKKYLHSIIKSYYVDYYNNILSQLQIQHDNLVSARQDALYHKQQLQNDIIHAKNRIISDRTTKLNTEQSIRKSRTKISKHAELIRVNQLGLSQQKEEFTNFEKDKADGKLTDEKEYLKMKRGFEKKILKTNNVITKSKKIKLKTEQKIVASETKILQLEADILENEKQIKATEKELLSAEKKIESSNDAVRKKEAQISKIKEQIDLIY